MSDLMIELAKFHAAELVGEAMHDALARRAAPLARGLSARQTLALGLHALANWLEGQTVVLQVLPERVPAVEHADR